MEFNWITKAGEFPDGTRNILFLAYPDDYDKYRDKIARDIFDAIDATIWFKKDLNESLYPEPGYETEAEKAEELSHMNLVVFPITREMIDRALEDYSVLTEIALMQNLGIPAIGIMMERGLEPAYTEVFGSIQFMDPYEEDREAISYQTKLRKYLESMLISEVTINYLRSVIFEGSIFLSYRRKNRKQANKLMRQIHDLPGFRDVAIWYDEYLVPGENYTEAIESAIRKCDIFVMAVTPDMVNEDNYVIDKEYPAAAGRRPVCQIVPVEMEETDSSEFAARFPGAPELVKAGSVDFGLEFAGLREKFRFGDSEDTPDRLYNMGLAYLNGIDVETNTDRGIQLIKEAAEAGLIDAAVKMAEIHEKGIGVRIDLEKGLLWRRRVVDLARIEGEWPLIHALGAFATACSDLNKREYVQNALEEILQIAARNPQEYPGYAAAALYGLGQIEGNKGNIEKMQQYVDDGVRILDDTLGEKLDSKEWFMAKPTPVMIKAQAALKAGDIDSACQLFDEVLESCEHEIARTNSVESRDSAGLAYYALSQCASRRGDSRERVRCCLQALVKWDSIPEDVANIENKISIIDCCRVIAENASREGKYDDALKYAARGYETYRSLLKHSETSGFIKTLGSRELRRSLYVCAEKCADVAATIAAMQSDADMFELWMRRRIDIIETCPEVTGSEKPALLTVRYLTYGLFFAGKDDHKAVKLLRKGLDFYEKAADYEWPGEEMELVRAGYMTAIAQCQSFGMDYEEDGKYEEAYDWFYSSYDLLRKFVYIELTDDTLRSMLISAINLADLLEKLGRDGEAALFWNIAGLTYEELFKRSGDPEDRERAIQSYYYAEDAALEAGDEAGAAKYREAARKLGAA